MAARKILPLGAFLLAFSLLAMCQPADAQQSQARLVRLAELDIDPTQLESYKSALKEEIEASIRLESGVLTLYAVAHKDNPTRISILETYADSASYNVHLQTPHFKKYKAATQNMIRSLKLIETEPIILGAKSR
jgi:quinol monooxygenase YgiN